MKMYNVGALQLQQTTSIIGANLTNNTSEEPSGEGINETLSTVYNVLLFIVTITCMLSMGTTIEFQHLKTIIFRPVGPIVGAICQLILMPAVCCGYALLLSLPDNIAIGMVLVGSTPGGTISNILTFWCKADIILSVCMTTISTSLSIGFLPLNMFIYSRFWIDDLAKIPYVNMVLTIIVLWISVAIGYFIGRKWPKTIPYVTKIGSLLTVVLILLASIVQKKAYPDLSSGSWKTFIAGVTMPLIGFLMGFLLSWIFCLGLKQRLAIGFETGIQNTALALTVVATTFESSVTAAYFSSYIILYTTFQIAFGVGFMVCIWAYNLIRYRETPCTSKHEFELTIADTIVDNKDRQLPEALGDDDQRRSTIALTENFEGSGLRLVSVVSGDFRLKTADESDTKSTSSTSGVSSLDSTDKETDARAKMEETSERSSTIKAE